MYFENSSVEAIQFVKYIAHFAPIEVASSIDRNFDSSTVALATITVHDSFFPLRSIDKVHILLVRHVSERVLLSFPLDIGIRPPIPRFQLGKLCSLLDVQP